MEEQDELVALIGDDIEEQRRRGPQKNNHKQDGVIQKMMA